MRASGREEREEGTEGLILGSFDITCLGQYMAFINKAHEKCLNQGRVPGKKNVGVTVLILSDVICFISIFTFIDMTH